jgi:hypothetical protein
MPGGRHKLLHGVYLPQLVDRESTVTRYGGPRQWCLAEELRPRGVYQQAEASALLREEYVPKFNERFQIQAAGRVWRISTLAEKQVRGILKFKPRYGGESLRDTA